MAWLYIPAETGERIETICNQHYNPGRGACDCPLWPACQLLERSHKIQRGEHPHF